VWAVHTPKSVQQRKQEKTAEINKSAKSFLL